MIKTTMFFARREGLSFEEFVEYYENNHSKLAGKYLAGLAVKYSRRYLQPARHPLSGDEVRPPFDAVTEIWFPDEARMAEFYQRVSDPDIARQISEDGATLFDPRERGIYLGFDRESNLPDLSI